MFVSFENVNFTEISLFSRAEDSPISTSVASRACPPTPNLHYAIDDDIESGDERTVIGG
jgi:hypothetical protein